MKQQNVLIVLGLCLAVLLLAGCGSDEESPIPTVQPGVTSGPFFAQSDSRWGNDVYAFADDKEFGPIWCGTTIAQCGSFLTSMATVFLLFDVSKMPDGNPLDPGSLNEWFKAQPNRTSGGIASRGYLANGDLDVKAVEALSSEISRKSPNCSLLRVAGTGSGTEDEIRAELSAGRPVILEVPGHWIVAVGLNEGKILINDPFYRDKKTLDVYAGRVRSSVMFSRVPGGGVC